MNIRQSYLEMIKSYSGGWDAMTGALGMTRDALENRIYERKGQGVRVDTALQMQAFSGSTYFAESVAIVSGGVFVKTPMPEQIDRIDLLGKLNELHAQIGMYHQQFAEFTKNDELDDKECERLSATTNGIHKALQESMAIMFSLYRPT